MKKNFTPFCPYDNVKAKLTFCTTQTWDFCPGSARIFEDNLKNYMKALNDFQWLSWFPLPTQKMYFKKKYQQHFNFHWKSGNCQSVPSSSTLLSFQVEIFSSYDIFLDYSLSIKALFPLHFLFSQTSPCVTIPWNKHDTCFLFLN